MRYASDTYCKEDPEFLKKLNELVNYRLSRIRNFHIINYPNTTTEIPLQTIWNIIMDMSWYIGRSMTNTSIGYQTILTECLFVPSKSNFKYFKLVLETSRKMYKNYGISEKEIYNSFLAYINNEDFIKVKTVFNNYIQQVTFLMFDEEPLPPKLDSKLYCELHMKEGKNSGEILLKILNDYANENNMTLTAVRDEIQINPELLDELIAKNASKFRSAEIAQLAQNGLTMYQYQYANCIYRNCENIEEVQKTHMSFLRKAYNYYF